MAYKPSERRNTNYAGSDLDIRPIMNLMVCLIPILLVSAEFSKMSELTVKLPPAASSNSTPNLNKNPESEKKKQLQFTVVITKGGFVLNALNTKLLKKKPKNNKVKQEPTIPIKEDGTYDFLALRKKAKALRAEINSSEFDDDQQVILTAEKGISYSVFVGTQDAIASEKVSDSEFTPLFPTVTVGVAL